MREHGVRRCCDGQLQSTGGQMSVFCLQQFAKCAGEEGEEGEDDKDDVAEEDESSEVDKEVDDNSTTQQLNVRAQLWPSEQERTMWQTDAGQVSALPCNRCLTAWQMCVNIQSSFRLRLKFQPCFERLQQLEV